MAGVSAVLLAAGESTRMGDHKALLPWQGTTLLEYQARSLLDGGCTEVVVVLGFQSARLRPHVLDDPRVRSVLNRRYRQGKTASIRAGLRGIDRAAEGVLIVGVDQPRPPELVAQLLAAFRQSGAPLVVPAYRGRRGHPVLFSAGLLPELMRISEEREGLREVVERYRAQRLVVESDCPLVTVNINTPEEYQAALLLAAGCAQDGRRLL
ncbi:MAG: nucleotidyltransferase family protein [Chloroflexi bacterium]|nr:nucleotidyltransferase family protein [Chloroflexota bacterium]